MNVVIVGFAKPDCTYVKGSLDISYSRTGLIFQNNFVSATGAELKASIAALKAAQPNTRVLLSAGGGDAAYNNWQAINTQCLKDLVDDLGFHGALHACTRALYDLPASSLLVHVHVCSMQQ